ncbi:hypothetical protein BCR32DRAFT_249427 [Anaeromyces robustus]|uniref:Uncharacterized protein n=1 Tax=Anaeromyces robustus TaxID=1754192 RepID=A0A1Y1WR82_9FUNG|nr:hypothetical protein BCR32DRAFT_249427 [Anaeromyces robustus]|eukprot:ORX75634.1 hypothetical protein BCR32DRAFT_249427 [Anaeromyces robustus]
MKYTNVKFSCEEDLSVYKDSLLFSNGNIIATLSATDNNGNIIDMELVVVGEIRIKFINDENSSYYSDPKDYPDELRNTIEKGMYDLLDIRNNNWFELSFSIKNINGKVLASDGDVYENDISIMTKDELKQEMLDYCDIIIDYYT